MGLVRVKMPDPEDGGARPPTAERPAVQDWAARKDLTLTPAEGFRLTAAERAFREGDAGALLDQTRTMSVKDIANLKQYLKDRLDLETLPHVPLTVAQSVELLNPRVTTAGVELAAERSYGSAAFTREVASTVQERYVSGALAVESTVKGAIDAKAASAGSFEQDGFRAVAEARFAAESSLSSAASLTYGSMAASGKVSVELAERVEARAAAELGASGAKAEAKAEAFWGMSAGGEAKLDVGAVQAGGAAGVLYGFGVHASAQLTLSAEAFGVKADVGAAFGLGLSGKVHFSVNPVAVVRTVQALTGWTLPTGPE
jgi:hypothetical protein